MAEVVKPAVQQKQVLVQPEKPKVQKVEPEQKVAPNASFFGV